MDALLGTKLTYEKVQAKIEAVRVAKGETANPKEYMALEKKATTYTKAQEFAKAIDLWIELVATATIISGPGVMELRGSRGVMAGPGSLVCHDRRKPDSIIALILY